jgi:predicted transcriptional regulator
MTKGGHHIDDETLAHRLAETTAAITANQQLRAEYIQMARDRGWSQDRIAEAARISQPAVSKRLKRPAKGDDTTQ